MPIDSRDPVAPDRRRAPSGAGRPGRSRSTGWLPQQHGAWAMLVVPFAVGALSSWQAGTFGWQVATIFATWMLSYFAFYAASGLLKAPPVRRARWYPALAVYGLATAAAGLATLALVGPSCLWWLVGFAPVLGVALWLAARRDERNLAGGLLTVLAACAMLVVVRFPDPGAIPGDPDASLVVILAALHFGYFAGTVFHVKAMIRRRRDLGWRRISVGWHAVWTLVAVGLAAAGQVGLAWVGFFLVTCVRSWYLPVLAERRRLRPAQIGAVEIVLTLAISAISAVTILHG